MEFSCEVSINIPILQMRKRAIRLNNLPRALQPVSGRASLELRFVESPFEGRVDIDLIFFPKCTIFSGLEKSAVLSLIINHSRKHCIMTFFVAHLDSLRVLKFLVGNYAVKIQRMSENYFNFSLSIFFFLNLSVSSGHQNKCLSRITFSGNVDTIYFCWEILPVDQWEMHCFTF